MGKFGNINRPWAMAQIFGVVERTIWRWSANGKIPHPIQISPGVVGWTDAMVEQIIADRKAGRMTTVMPESAPETVEKRSPGRPRKVPLAIVSFSPGDDAPPKRRPGRPRKIPVTEIAE